MNFQIHPQSYQKQWLSHACHMQHVSELRVVHVVHEYYPRNNFWRGLCCFASFGLYNIYGNISPAQTSLAWFEQFHFCWECGCIWSLKTPVTGIYMIFNYKNEGHSLLSTLWFCNSKVVGKKPWKNSHNRPKERGVWRGGWRWSRGKGVSVKIILVYRICVASQNVCVICLPLECQSKGGHVA